MRELRRIVAAVAMLALGASCGACAGSQSASEESAAESSVQGEPPEEEPPERMPQGPPVEVDGDVPDEKGAPRAEEEAKVPPRDAGRGGRQYVSEAQVESLLERGPSYIFQVVTVEPVEKEGAFAGYRIVGAERVAREKMRPQLKVGDLVVEVNGVPIERPDDYVAAWEKLERKAVLEVEYVRDGETGRALWVVRERAADLRGGEGSGERR